MPKIKPLWAREVEKKLIDLGMNKKELATEINVNHVQLCNTLSGYINNVDMRKKICAYLGFSEETQ